MSKIRASLRPHPASQDLNANDIIVTGERGAQSLLLTYSMAGRLSALQIPEGTGGKRRDELWRHTCFEAFVRLQNAQPYYEFNFAPNGDWAAYEFEAYRTGGSDLEDVSIEINTQQRPNTLTLTVMVTGLPSTLFNQPISMGLSAVIEAKNGERSFWALHHPLNKPDFHHIDSFKLNLD